MPRQRKPVPGVDPKLLIKDAAKLLPEPSRRFFPVSYTHLDVYKRQSLIRSFGSTPGIFLRSRGIVYSSNYRPRIMARKLFGTMSASVTWTVKNPTIDAMAKKWT